LHFKVPRPTMLHICVALLIAVSVSAKRGGGGSSGRGGSSGSSGSSSGSSSSSSDVVYRGSMSSGLFTFPPQTIDVTVTEDTVTLSMECWGTGGWCGFGFGQGLMEGSYAIVSTTSDVREYILSKDPIDGDQSENEISSGERGLVILENTSDMLTRKATVERSRVSADGFTFPFDSTGNTKSFEIAMITAKADYYEPELFYHGSQCSAMETLTLTVVGGSSSSGSSDRRSSSSSSEGGNGGRNGGGGGRGGNNGRRRKESSLFVELEGDAETNTLTASEVLFGAVLLVVAAFAIDQLWRWSTSDGSKLQVSTGDEDNAPLLSHADGV